MPRLRDQAICIRHLDWSETSQLVVLLTERHGKLRGLAKGSKRMSPSSQARFSGGIGMLTRGEVLATTRASSELAAITEWDLQDPYPHFRRDLDAQRLGLFAADAVNAVLAEEDPHPGSYTALRTCFEALAERDPRRRQAALLRFQWDVLADTGYKPELWRDVHTGEALDEPATYTFDPIGGGLTRRPGPGAEDWRVRGQTVALLRKAAANEDLTPADEAGLKRGNRLLCVYLRAILDKDLPTMGYVLES